MLKYYLKAAKAYLKGAKCSDASQHDFSCGLLDEPVSKIVKKLSVYL